MKSVVQNRRYPRTVKEALSTLKVADRTFRRKRKIAELMILDRSRFDQVVAKQIRDFGGSVRLSQDTLADRCTVELQKPDMIAKRRDAILSGDII